MNHPPPPRRHILVAGIGNIFLGDDAFGSELARRLLTRPLPPGVEVVDFGIRGLDLTYALLDGCDAAILLDAAPRRTHPPGTLYVLEPRLGPLSSDHHAPANPFLDAHSMDPLRVLQAVATLGGPCGRVLLVGCEPTPSVHDAPTSDEFPADMSPPVRAAVDHAVPLVESLIQQLLLAHPNHSGLEVSHLETSAVISGPASTFAPLRPTSAAEPEPPKPAVSPFGIHAPEPTLSKESDP